MLFNLNLLLNPNLNFIPSRLQDSEFYSLLGIFY